MAEDMRKRGDGMCPCSPLPKAPKCPTGFQHVQHVTQAIPSTWSVCRLSHSVCGPGVPRNAVCQPFLLSPLSGWFCRVQFILFASQSPLPVQMSSPSPPSVVTTPHTSSRPSAHVQGFPKSLAGSQSAPSL